MIVVVHNSVDVFRQSGAGYVEVVISVEGLEVGAFCKLVYVKEFRASEPRLGVDGLLCLNSTWELICSIVLLNVLLPFGSFCLCVFFNILHFIDFFI